MRVALVTWSGLPELSVDDHILRDALRERGAGTEAVVWSDRAVEWRTFDAVVVRSTWDYHRRIDEFVTWIDRLADEGVPVRNPAAVLRWNVHKSYLAGLAQGGIAVVPTVTLRRPVGPEIQRVMEEQSWVRAVVKPAVSATAHRTYVIDRDDGDLPLPLADEVLLQPFVDEIVTEGEWSLVFIDGEYSHAVLKKPRAGDFRVQSDFGGSAIAMQPPHSLIEDAAAALRFVDRPLLYARVDGVARGDRLLLMELELTEPALFFATNSGAAARMAAAILGT